MYPYMTNIRLCEYVHMIMLLRFELILPGDSLLLVLKVQTSIKCHMQKATQQGTEALSPGAL